MNTSDQINELVTAFVAARGKFGAVKKDAKGQVGQNRNYKYADLTSILDATTEVLLAHGLVVSQPIEAETSSLVTKLMHVSGQWIESRHPLPKYDRPQDFGSALTYARRYSLQALLCLSADDDDGAAAQKASETKREPAPASRPTPAAEPNATQIADELSRVATSAPLYVMDVKQAEVVRDVQYYAITLSDNRVVRTKDQDVVSWASDFKAERTPVTVTTKPTRHGGLLVEHFASALPFTASEPAKPLPESTIPF